MKKILLSVFTCLSLTTLALAQGFTTQHGDTSIAAITGSDVQVKNNITNNTASTVTYDWKVVGQSFPAGWNTSGLCDNNLCYTPPFPSSNVTSSPVNAGATMTYYVTFLDEGAPNSSAAWVQATINETGGSALDAKTLTFIATKGTLSTINVTKYEDDIVVFPNPAKNFVNVVYSADMGVKNIGVYNLIGKMVSVYKVGSNSAKLDVDNLPSGIYFIRLFNSQGKVIGTRKFTHQ